MILLKRLYMMNWLKMLMQLIQTKTKFERKIEDSDKKTPDTSKFIKTQKVNRLTKINFNPRMSESSKNLATKNQVEFALDKR